LKTARKILLISVLATIIILTLIASKCANEVTTEILNEDLAAIDTFLSEVDTSPYPYQLGEGWLYGIIVRKQWTDSVTGYITSTNLSIRTIDRETVIFSPGELRSRKAKWDRLSTGDLVAFRDPTLPYSGPGAILESGLYVIMPNKETGFIEKIRDNTAF